MKSDSVKAEKAIHVKRDGIVAKKKWWYVLLLNVKNKIVT